MRLPDGGGRWDPCVSHRGAEIDGFVDTYFARPERRILLVGGAGFDPRSTAVARRLANTEGQIRGLFLQEERPRPTQTLVDRAVTNGDVLRAAIPAHDMASVNIFGSDGAVVGGRNAVGVIGRQDFTETTDVVVDISALSVGTAFPIIRYLVERSVRAPAEFESGWSVDTRNIVYADESDPLDLYRTILRLDDLRKPVFAEVGGSLLILSPLGSKVMALGALMAALERDLPVAYLEAIGYEFEGAPANEEAAEVIHIWL